MFKKPVAKILMIGLPLAILILFLILVVFSKKAVQPTTTTETNATPTPEKVKTDHLSSWAKDEKFINLENAILETEKKFDKIDLREYQLDAPDLDLNVKL